MLYLIERTFKRVIRAHYKVEDNMEGYTTFALFLSLMVWAVLPLVGLKISLIKWIFLIPLVMYLGFWFWISLLSLIVFIIVGPRIAVHWIIEKLSKPLKSIKDWSENERKPRKSKLDEYTGVDDLEEKVDYYDEEYNSQNS